MASIAGDERWVVAACAPGTACGDSAALRVWHSAHARAPRVSRAIFTRSRPVHHTPGSPSPSHAFGTASLRSCRIVKIYAADAGSSRPYTDPLGGTVPLWIPITVFAALCQNIRTTMQQKIRGVLSVDGANFVRYLYGAPLALAALAFLVFGTGRQGPTITLAFLGLVTIAGVPQIVATALLIQAFWLRNYADRPGYSKPT